MRCPRCQGEGCVIKKGHFPRKTGDAERIARFYCKRCRRYSSTQTGHVAAGHRRPEINWLVYRLLAMGNSQRAIARLLRVTPATIARRVERFGAFAARHHAAVIAANPRTIRIAEFDEMETFQHSKLKPVSIVLAVEANSRIVLGVRAEMMPAKGKTAAVAYRRYGYRPDRRPRALATVLRNVAHVAVPDVIIKSDMCPRYPRAIAKHVPGARHSTFRSRRASVVGQGEMKEGGFDPLFSINHSNAMYRDNLKRLARRTWCTTKRIDRLQCLLNIYACAHNDLIASRQATKKARRRPSTFLALPWPGAAMGTS